MPKPRAQVLDIKDFRILLIARICSSNALLVQAVIVGWQVYRLTDSALLLGLIGLTEAIPAICCSFVSGHLVDNHRPASIYRLSLVTLLLNALLLWVSVAEVFAWSDHTRLIFLFTAVFISGAARSFSGPSVFTIIPQIVPRSMLASASAWNSTAYQVAAITGPAIGGLVYGEFGAQVAFALPAVFQVGATLMASRLSRECRALRSTEKREPFLQSIGSGLKFAFGHKVLLSTMSLDMFSVFFGGATAVLPIYADRVLHVGSQGLGLLRAAPSIGSGLMAIGIALFPNRLSISGRVLLLVVAGFGLSTVGFALSTNFVLSLIFLAASGAFDGVSMVIRSTILQLLTPTHMRGRVSSVSSVFITSSNEIGAFESGVAARMLGLVPSVVFGGVMTLVVVALTAWRVPDLNKTKIAHDS